MQISALDAGVLLGYLVVVFGIGLWFARGNDSTEEYFVGGRRFRGWVIGLSLVGTSISSVTFIAYPADAFKTTWLRYLPNLTLPIAVALAAWLILPIFRRGRTTTAYEFLEQRFGPSVRVYGAVAFIIAQLVRLATILWLLSLLLQQITGLSPVTAIVLSGLFVGTYTILGGIDAVIWTDVIQTIVLLLGGMACLWVIVDLLPGGLGQILSTATEAGKFSFGEMQQGEITAPRWDLSLSAKTGSMLLLVGLTNWLTEYTSNQNTVQRYCAAASTAEARRGMLVCVLASLPIWAFYMFLGTALWVLFQVQPALPATEILDGTRKAEQLLPWFITEFLPPGITGLVLAAALAAAMSSMDSSINSIATVSVVDIYRRHVRPGAADRHYLHAAWAIAAATTLCMIAGALLLERASTNTLQDVILIMVSLLGGGLLGLYILGFISRRGDARAAWCGIACTLLFTGWTVAAGHDVLPDAMAAPFDLYYTGLIGNLIMFGVGYVAALLWGRRSTAANAAA